MTENGNGSMVMPVSPMYGNGGGMGGGFGWGSDIWLILIVLFALGGWGGGFGGGFGGGYGNMMLGYDFPWLLNGQQGINNNVSYGFRDQMLQTTISSTNDRLANLSTQLCDCCGNISTQLCNGFNGVNMSVNTAQNAIAQQLYGNQIATLQGFNGVQTQIAQASVDNRLGIANLGSDIAREACADRQAVNEGVRDILAIRPQESRESLINCATKNCKQNVERTLTFVKNFFTLEDRLLKSTKLHRLREDSLRQPQPS